VLLLSVAVLTAGRTTQAQARVEQLERMVGTPIEILVVDVSEDESCVDQMTLAFPAARILHLPAGSNSRRRARRCALEHARGDVLAFVDDDAVLGNDWITQIMRPYDDPEVAGVGGRVAVAGAEASPAHLIELGRVLPDGRLGDDFSSNPARCLVVEHLSGSNMSFRLSVLRDLPSLDQTFPGTETHEDTDLCLRVVRTGGQLIFNPRASVTRPSPGRIWGRRSRPSKWVYFAGRNHVKLLADHYGLSAPTTRHFIRITWRSHRLLSLSALGRCFTHAPTRSCPSTACTLIEGSVGIAGLAAGLCASLKEHAMPRVHTRSWR
jgi:cellulose synthase/poly-beta-1,6-N-acetylglucosamine synthase-like glycosyltransferase